MAETPEPAVYDFAIPLGACETLAIQLVDEGENIIDLTGYEAELDITWPDGSLHFSSEGSPDTIIIYPLSGQLDAPLTAEQTAMFPLGRRTLHRWWLIEPDGCRKVPLKGYIVGE